MVLNIVSNLWPTPEPSGVAQAGDGVGHEAQLHLHRLDPLVVDEAPEPLYAVKQLMLLGAATLLRFSGVG
jgi:hypothetical protein